MKKTILLPILILSIFIFSGCTGGKELFLQSVNKTAPEVETENLGPSFAPVNINSIDSYGNVLTTRQDKPLYTYSKDSYSESKCYDDCAVAWPPFLVNYEEEVGGLYSVIQRVDGTLQVTYKGKPLYTYTPDSPNKVTGDGKGGLWSVVVIN